MSEAPAFICPTCSFRLWLPITRLVVSTLGLYDDDRFPGRCLLVLNEHREDFSILDPDLTARFVADAQRAARAMSTALGVNRVNFAILGNTEPHVHFHLIPRNGKDPLPSKSPWNHPDPVRKLEPSKRDQIIDAIQAEISSQFRSYS